MLLLLEKKNGKFFDWNEEKDFNVKIIQLTKDLKKKGKKTFPKFYFDHDFLIKFNKSFFL